MVRFLVELTSKSEIIIHPTPSNNYDKKYNVYEIDINEHPENTYWTEWGGYYDNFVDTQIELYYERFLDRVNTLDDVLTTPFSIFITNENIVLLNIPKHPWLYPDYSVESSEVIPFLSSPLNPDNPSNNILRNVNVQTKLEIPNFIVKLSDNIAGITLNQGFTVNLNNNDGFFDDDIKWNLFNTPIHLKKSIIENPRYEDFHTIRNGLIENTITSFDKIRISVSDRLKSMNEPICKVIRQSDFPSIIIDNSNIGKNIPIIYGTKIIQLQKLNELNYIGAESITQVHNVYDFDGNVLQYNYNPVTNIITSTNNANTALITGYTNNKIGQIIENIIFKNTDTQFNNSNWNLNETNDYIDSSPVINIAIVNGSIKNAIQEILKSDMAFFIQQIDGRFTIRKYGKEYNIHEIPSWVITKKVEKNYNKAHDNYFSSCVVNYDYIDDENYKSYLYSSRENEAENKYRRRVTKIFNTDLIEDSDVRSLCELLSDRYTAMKQTAKVAIGIDTSIYELLDTVIIDLTINDRKFSDVTKYIITEINPSQDVITLEEI